MSASSTVSLIAPGAKPLLSEITSLQMFRWRVIIALAIADGTCVTSNRDGKVASNGRLRSLRTVTPSYTTSTSK